jgi:hypothetical protein
MRSTSAVGGLDLRSRPMDQDYDLEIPWDEEDDDADLREITRKYLPNAVVWTTDWTTGSLLEQMERGLFDLEPPFQRRNVWSDRRASLYIESLLLGCPVPAITLAEVSETAGPQYVVIDGKQRLTSLRRFAATRELRLTGLEVLGQFTGAGYDELQAKAEFARFENLPIRTVIVRNWQKDEVLHFMFHRLNTQVTPLSTHELRRSLIPGAFTSYLDQRSAASGQLHRLLGITEPDYRLRDAELLLRGIAFAEFLPVYKGNLKRFLDQVTRRLNREWSSTTESRVNAIVESLEETIDVTFDIFGQHAFQRFEDRKPVGRFNRAVYDTHVVVFREPQVRAASRANADAVRAAFAEVFELPDVRSFFEATTKTRRAVEGRLRAWSELLSGAIKMPVRVPVLDD